jgi:hypothetical protein
LLRSFLAAWNRGSSTHRKSTPASTLEVVNFELLVRFLIHQQKIFQAHLRPRELFIFTSMSNIAGRELETTTLPALTGG